jgi:glycosyltransferase involved in cell wall biosynthesis
MTSSKKRETILFVVNVDWFFLSHRRNLAEEALRRGMRVHVACLGTDKISEIRDMGCVVHELPLKREGHSLLNFFNVFVRVFALLRRVNPNIVHAVTTKPNLICGILAGLMPSSQFILAISGFGIASERDSFVKNVRYIIIKYVYSRILRNKNLRVIVQNERDKQDMYSLYPPASGRIYPISGSGVDLNEFKFFPRGLNRRVLFASRLLLTKGIAVYLDAAERWREKFSESGSLEFLVAGKFDQSNPDCVDPSLIYKSQKKGAIHFLGDISDMAGLLKTVDILVLPSSYGEGLPKVMSEAAACGVVCLASSIPGCAEAIIEAETGYFINPNSADDIVAKIAFLLNDEAGWKNMSEAAAKFAQCKFKLTDITEKHFLCYEGRHPNDLHPMS